MRLPPSSAEISLAVVVQHHPKRASLLDSLIHDLGECDVITDPDPDGKPAPIRTYLACLRAMPPRATHLAVIQDDARPCQHFASKMLAAVSAKPDSIVALFLAGAPAKSARLAKQAHRRGERWVLLHPDDWCPTVATVWPRDLAARFLAFAEEKHALVTKGDDNVAGAFVTSEKVPVWVTVPSLVEHPDVVPSLIGRKAGAGSNRYRVAAVPPGS